MIEEESQTKRHRGAQPGNINRLKHGFYSRRFGRQEESDLEQAGGHGIQNEIALIRILIRRVFEYALEEATDLKTWAQTLEVLGAASSRLAILLRTEKQLQGKPDALVSALSGVLSDIIKEKGSA